MEERGDLYLDRYEGWYSVRDEAYYEEERADRRRTTARSCRRTARRSNGRSRRAGSSACPNTSSRCSTFMRRNPDFIRPESRRNEVVRFVEGGLKDLSISRTSFDWGVPVPGSDSHVMYVWLDALTNYITGLGYPDDTELWRRYWPADVHLIGKDVVRFHAVYWPAFLMSAGIALPEAGVRPRLPAQPRREDVEERRQCRRPDGARRALRRRCAALFPAARSDVRPGRQLQRRSDRHPRQCRARQQLRQPRPAHLVRSFARIWAAACPRSMATATPTTRCSTWSAGRSSETMPAALRATSPSRKASRPGSRRCSPATPISTSRRRGRCARPIPSAWRRARDAVHRHRRRSRSRSADHPAQRRPAARSFGVAPELGLRSIIEPLVFDRWRKRVPARAADAAVPAARAEEEEAA